MAKAASAPPDVLAAVDLGSNSFHLVVARHSHGQLVVIDRVRELVRFGAGIDENGRIDSAVAERALACLERIGQRLRTLRAGNVRVVGTNALRLAHRKRAFLERARAALGHPIEVISGMEEARLIYSGVAHSSPAETGRRLVIDIGGGSTELIIGTGFEPLEMASLQLGCVTLTGEFFASGRLSAKRLKRARLKAQGELEPVQEAFKRRGWDSVVGSSGSVRAVCDAVRELHPDSVVVSAAHMSELLELLATSDHCSGIGLQSLDEERRPVFAAAVVIMHELFNALRIQHLRHADGALRDGLLYDMLGRMGEMDPRARTVRSMQQRYHVDLPQAERVDSTVKRLLAAVEDAWDLQDPMAELMLSWAARLHEIGLDVAHSGYHRHGAYLLQNADLPGFSREEQSLLACLVGAHRRRPGLESAQDLVPPWDEHAVRLVTLLRLAVLLHRSRSADELPLLRVAARGRTLELHFPARWLKDHPLTVADLQQEAHSLREAGIRLRVYSGRRASELREVAA